MKWSRVGSLLALVWLFSVVLSYYVIHNPFTGSVLIAIGSDIVDLAMVGLLLLVGGALGATIMRDLAPLSDLEQAALQALLGLGVVSVVVLGAGLAGVFPPTWLAWLIMLGLLGGLYRPARTWLSTAIGGLRLAFQAEAGGFTRWMRISVLVLLGLAAILSLTPPTAWDTLTYHLAGPRHYLEAGRIVSFPENHFLGFPQLAEMLYLWLMIVARPQAAGLLHWCYGVLVLALLLGATRRLGRPTAGWVAAAVLLVSDSMWLSFHWAYNDLTAMAYTLAALLALLSAYNPEGERRNYFLIWTGVFTGLMMGTKYTAAGFTIGIGVLTAWLARRDGAWGLVRAVATVSLIAVAVFTPTLIKNTLLDGNPVSPFVWGTAAFDEHDQWYYLRSGTGLTPVELLFAPLQATVFGMEKRTPYQASSGALALGLLPLVLIGWRRRDRIERQLIIHLLIFIVPSYLIWLNSLATSAFLVQTRLLYPLFPAIALIDGVALDGLRDFNKGLDVGRMARPIVLVVLALAVIESTLAFIQVNPLPVLSGMENEEQYLSRTLGVHYVAMQQINALPEEARVLTLWEPQIYYCERRCIPDSLINQWWHDRQIEPDPLKIARRWREAGITHILIFEAGMNFLYYEEPHEPLTEDDMEALDTLRERALAPVWDEPDAYTLYKFLDEVP